jgi:uncharacterized repeat protein (TIGR01451 family)
MGTKGGRHPLVVHYMYMFVMKIMKQHKKIVIITVIAILAAAAIAFATFHKKNAENEVSVQKVDTSIGQYPDRANVLPAVVTPVASTSRPSSSQQPSSAPLAATCTLEYALQPNVSTVRNGDKVTYAVSLRNDSLQACQDASLSVYYSENETFVSASLTPSASSNYYWKFGTLSSGQQKKFTITTQATQDDSTSIHTDSCASADGANDACDASDIIISGVDTTIASVPTTSAAANASSSTPVAATSATATINNGERTYGLWVWVSPIQMSNAYMDSIMTAAKTNGFNAVYLTIDDYLDILALPNGSSKDAQEAAYSSALERFVSLAHQNGVQVYAEAGSRDWSEDPSSTDGLEIVDYAMQYNKDYPNEMLTGFQYDVEPYLLPAYGTDPAKILEDYVSFVDATAQHLGGNSLKFSIVLPHFYDSVVDWTPSFIYKGTSGYAYDHLLTIMDSRPGSSIVIMAYRNTAAGTNGTIALADTEVTQASAGSHSTKIIVGQETGNVSPAYVTFYGQTKAQYVQQVNQVENAFNADKAFGGIAVDYFDTFEALK